VSAQSLGRLSESAAIVAQRGWS